MMNKAVFLDRDGTINVEKNYLYQIKDFEYIAGAIDAMRMMQDAGYQLIIITNQSGIARGYYQEKDFSILNKWMISSLAEKGINISQVYYCPHLPTASIEAYRKDCNCRKPRTGLFYQAVTDFDLDLSQCYAIGDKIRDCAICSTSSCKGYLISNHEQPEIIDRVKRGEIYGVKYAYDLLGAAIDMIANHETK